MGAAVEADQRHADRGAVESRLEALADGAQLVLHPLPGGDLTGQGDPPDDLAVFEKGLDVDEEPALAVEGADFEFVGLSPQGRLISLQQGPEALTRQRITKPLADECGRVVAIVPERAAVSQPQHHVGVEYEDRYARQGAKDRAGQGID